MGCGRNFVIRRATTADLSSLARLERENLTEGWSDAALREMLTLPGSLILVAQAAPDASRLLGWIGCHIVRDEGEIRRFFVTGDSRRTGVGMTLLARAVRDLAARNVRTVFLEVRNSNDGARRLYEKQVFHAVGCRPAYYRSPTEDALLLSRDLSGRPLSAGRRSP